MIANNSVVAERTCLYQDRSPAVLHSAPKSSPSNMGNLFKQDQGWEHHLWSKTEPKCLVCHKPRRPWWCLAWLKPTPSWKRGRGGTWQPAQRGLGVHGLQQGKEKRDLWAGGGEALTGHGEPINPTHVGRTVVHGALRVWELWQSHL